MAILDRLYMDKEFPTELFSKIKKNIKYNFAEDNRNVSKFIEDLPHNLRADLSLYVYDGIYKSISFFKNRSKCFIAWICPQLKPFVTTPGEFVYNEGDEVKKIYFLLSS